MSNEKKMFAINKKSDCVWEHECEYATFAEANIALEKMRTAAIERDKKRAEWLAAHPKPWNEQDKHTVWINGYDKKQTNVEQFEDMGWHIEEIEANPIVYRLNTLPAESEPMMREIEAKMAMFGECELRWTCLGHTRAEWQTQAACEQLKKAHPEWNVECGCPIVRIKAK